MDPKKFANKTQDEISVWSLVGRTAPFVAMTGFGLCYVYAETLLFPYIIAVTLLWVFVSVFWWWWAIWKISRITKLMFDTRVSFEEVMHELKEIKDDVGNRKRREPKDN